MKRRHLLATSAAFAAAPLGAAPAKPRSILELRYYRLRNGNQIQRTSDFLSKHFQPAAQRAGVGPMGFFGAVIGEQSPFVLALVGYPSLAAMDIALDKMAADKEFQKGFDEYNSGTELSYVRIENSLYRAFETIPSIEVPPAGRAPRTFELRTYESNNEKAGKRKIRMFDYDGEIAIFRRLGMIPIFFGEALVASRLPHLTYMLAYDDMAARDKAWRAFGADPEWQKLRLVPELADPLLVSNISNTILRPLAFSGIK